MGLTSRINGDYLPKYRFSRPAKALPFFSGFLAP